MATNRKLRQQRETFKHNNTITYDATKVGGSDHALGNFAVTMTGNGEVGLVGADNSITGELLTVEEDGYCSVIVEGQGLQFKMGTASAVTAGDVLVGATGDSVGGQTGGYVKASGSGDEDARGLATEVSGTAKNSIVTANFP